MAPVNMSELLVIYSSDDQGQGLHKVWLTGQLWDELCLVARLSALISS